MEGLADATCPPPRRINPRCERDLVTLKARVLVRQFVSGRKGTSRCVYRGAIRQALKCLPLYYHYRSALFIAPRGAGVPPGRGPVWLLLSAGEKQMGPLLGPCLDGIAVSRGRTEAILLQGMVYS